MKRLLLATLFLALGCGQSTHTTSNKNYNVELLFEHDGVKVYRFTDQLRYRYYVDARGKTEWSESTGNKKTQIDESIVTID